MAGYSRQSVADIIAGAVVKAAPINAELNALRDTFAFSTGHTHDGSSTEGAYVPLIADTDGNNKVVIDTANNRISFYTEVSANPVEQLRIQDGAIVPVTDDDIDLGASGAEFKDLYVDGIGYIDSVVITGGTIDDTVIGGTTPAAADFTTVDTTGNASVGGNLSVTGTTDLTGAATITSADINSGTMDNTTIGATTAAAGTFTNLTATGSTTLATADINGGTLDNATVGATTPSTGAFTTLSATGTSTLTTVDINGGAIDGTIIGGNSATSAAFTTVSTSGQATLASADINGGTIDGAVIGGTSASGITGTTITANTGFTGALTGDVTGNVTGNLTGNVTGDVTGDLTGNVTAASGSSSFNNVTINGTLDVTSTTITNVTDPINAQDAATKNYVDTEVAALVDSAPGTLDTLNELAAALGDDPNFSTTITNSIATKLPLAGGTMSGAIAMGTNKITGMGDPTANQDAATKAYVDTQDATKLSLSGGTMTGAIDMGSSKITTTYTPTDAADLTTKTYVDAILGSATAAATSASNAATSETNAATSATNAATSESNAATSATNAAASYDDFDDRYLGAKSSAPTLDNDGDALVIGALYFNTTTNIMYVYSSSGWQAAGSSVNGTSDRQTYTATSGQTTFAVTYDVGYVDVWLNGSKLLAGTDFTATSGTSIVLTTGATAGDIVDIVAYGTFVLADHLTETQSDAKYAQLSNNLSDLASAATARTNLGLGTADSPSFAAITTTGNITVGGTVDGRDIAADGTKLDGIEALADVTDTANVTAAGALMDSELTDINAIKNLDQGVATTDGVTFANITTTGYLRGPASFTIDPATHGDNTGTVVIAGNLQVDGTTTTVNSSTLDVDDLNITVASGAANAAAANGAGLTVDGASATLTYVSATDNWALNKALDVTGNITVSGTVDGRDLAADGTKLDGIEAAADVTDTTNVTAAGALMDSELTNITAVKALNQGVASTDSPTFVTANVTTVDLGDWTVTESSGTLFFAYQGTNKMKVDSSGNLTCVGDVTAFGTV